MGWILLLFTLVPIVEMYLLITVGGLIGALPTIACVMLTAVVGVTLLRVQGFQTLTRGAERARSGQLPGHEIAEGMMLAVAGALLLTPGFVTDAIGFALLVPLVRAGLIRLLRSRVQVVDLNAGSGAGPFSGAAPGADSRPGQRAGTTLEGEFERRP